MTTSSKKISEADGVEVVAKKPRLVFKKDIFGDLKVRVHHKDKFRNIQKLYDFLSDWGHDPVDKAREFELQGWVKVPQHLREELSEIFILVPFK